MSDIVPDFNLNLSFSDEVEDDNQAFKFDLFLMTREIKQISSSLSQVKSLSPAKKSLWMKDNQKLLHTYMDKLTHEMFNVIDEASLDKDAIHETIACVTEMRSLVNTLNSLMK